MERRTQFFPVGKQLCQGARVHDGAAQDMCAGLRALLEHHNRNVGALFKRQLFQPYRRGQTARATAYHDHVVFHRFTGAKLGQDFLIVHGGAH